MKNIFRAMLMALPVFAYSQELDTDRLLNAISQVESGDNDNAKGKDGEVSRYQLMPSTWALHSEVPKAHANNPVRSREAARSYLLYLRARLDTDSPYRLALAWTAGPNCKHPSRGKRDHARRVTNLYEDVAFAAPRHAGTP